MPKRRMSSRRRAQIKAWQIAGAKARAAGSRSAGSLTEHHGSYSSPHMGPEKLGWSPRKQRTIKYMGKAAHKHSNPTSSVTIAPYVTDLLAGRKPKPEERRMFHPKHFEGNSQMTQAKGVPYRRQAAPKVNGKSVVGQNKIKVADSLGLSVADAKKKMAADSRKIKAAQKAADKKKYAAAKAAYQKSALGKKYK